jgi:hypothetical protein
MEELLEGLKTFDPGVPHSDEFISFVPNSEWQRQNARENALKRNATYKGANNPRAKTWKITYEDGKVEIVKALQPWRIEKGYNKLGLRKLQLKEWKKYKDLVAVEEVSHETL